MNIADDRIGLDPLSAQTVGHFGLMMRELEKALLGDLNVDISPGQGTQLNFRIPRSLHRPVPGDPTSPIYPSAPIIRHFWRD